MGDFSTDGGSGCLYTMAIFAVVGLIASIIAVAYAIVWIVNHVRIQ